MLSEQAACRMLCEQAECPPVERTAHPIDEEPAMAMKLVGIAKRVGKLLLIELLVPGGSLVVLAILLAGSAKCPAAQRLAHIFTAPSPGGRTAKSDDPVASCGPRRMS
jgi:hypothetical protein